jgi:hypothetical protein
MRIPALLRKQKRVRLTCRCGMPYTLNTIYDLRSRCINFKATAGRGLPPVYRFPAVIAVFVWLSHR